MCIARKFYSLVILGFLALVFFAGYPAPLHAWDGDSQARLGLHLYGTTTGGWVVMPDLTSASPRTLVVMGPAWRDNSDPEKDSHKKRWVELLGGGFLNADGTVHPVANVRAATSLRKFSLYADALYDLEGIRTSGLSRGVLQLQANYGSGSAKFGSEIELVKTSGRPTVFGIGPCVSKSIGPANFAAAYQFRNRGGDVLRLYTVVNF